MGGDVMQISVLFVCLGNICRSPIAEGAFRARAEAAGLAGRFRIDSAGTGSWHVGAPPDPRSVLAAAGGGFDISGQRARQVRRDDFAEFDLVLAMDRSNLDNLRRLRPTGATAEVALFLDYALSRREDVPDPYYGGADGFTAVTAMIEEAAEALLARLARRLPVTE